MGVHHSCMLSFVSSSLSACFIMQEMRQSKKWFIFSHASWLEKHFASIVDWLPPPLCQLILCYLKDENHEYRESWTPNLLIKDELRDLNEMLHHQLFRILPTD